MRNSIRWIVLGAIIFVLLGTLGALQACNHNGETPETQPASGGAVEATSAAPTDGSNPDTGTVTETVAGPTPVVFAQGSVHQAARQLVLYATAASSSTVLDLYAPGSEFTVLEPNGDYIAYPVTSGGASWVRLRAADGLAGWAKADELEQ
jgi:hypothetical protein